ncbi:MAG: hypothetical protein K2P79_09580 [Sphingomonas sp.]|nr:hypothetical protein [Sphingomonas sp.]
MFKWISGRVACLGGTHARDKDKVRKLPGAEHYESVCSYCGTPMLRLGKRNWVTKHAHRGDA